MQVRSVFLFTARWFTKKPFRSAFVGQPRLKRAPWIPSVHPRSKVSSLFAPAILKFAPVVPIEVFPLSLPTGFPTPSQTHQPQLRVASGQRKLRIESTENVGGHAKLWKVHHLVYCVPTFSLFGRKSKAYEFAQRVSAASAADWDR